MLAVKHFVGVWLSLARALRSGRRGRRFKSSHPDHFFAHNRQSPAKSKQQLLTNL